MAKAPNGNKTALTAEKTEMLKGVQYTDEQIASLTEADLASLPNFADWSEEQIGFAPYWAPEPGKWFYGTLVARDERDPSFVRYLCKALMPLPCKRGAGDEVEDVLIKAGEHFSMSVYYSLEKAFNFYLETQEEKGVNIPVRVQADKKVKTKSSQDCWQFKVSVSQNTKKMLDSKRLEVKQLERSNDDERKALQA